jgi:uncharacterized phage protein (TIGR02218 family)
MSRTVPAALQTHLNTGTTTTTVLMRIDPVTPGYDPIGITALDKDLTYNDGAGSLTYYARIGMVPAAMVASSGMDVPNSETQHLLPEFDLPITEEDIAAGVYDFATYTVYLVNFESLADGHVVLDHGPLGQMRMENGLSFWSEQTGLSKYLKTNIVEKDSITCRAVFGSQPLGTVGALVTQKQPCGFDAEALYNGPHTVTSVGTETNFTFGASGLVYPASTFAPGMCRWLTGDNTGQTYEVESQDGAGVISLAFATKFPIVNGDTFEIRQDCSKWVTGTHGCDAFWASDWVLHYRGEPYIPIADADAIQTPGATVGKSA